MQVKNLVKALENATAMAKHLPSTTTDSANIYAALHDAHRHLSLFLQSQPQPPPDVDEPMQIADNEQQQQVVVNEEDSKMITMEEQMKDISIQSNKRLKRSTSFDETTERIRWLEYGIESARARFDYDSRVARFRALDLIYQFHA